MRQKATAWSTSQGNQGRSTLAQKSAEALPGNVTTASKSNPDSARFMFPSLCSFEVFNHQQKPGVKLYDIHPSASQGRILIDIYESVK
jgi:hypothetical protein